MTIFDLPPEIRLRIYEFAVGSDQGILLGLMHVTDHDDNLVHQAIHRMPKRDPAFVDTAKSAEKSASIDDGRQSENVGIETWQALCLTRRAIYQEAQPVLYSINTFTIIATDVIDTTDFVDPLDFFVTTDFVGITDFVDVADLVVIDADLVDNTELLDYAELINGEFRAIPDFIKSVDILSGTREHEKARDFPLAAVMLLREVRIIAPSQHTNWEHWEINSKKLVDFELRIKTASPNSKSKVIGTAHTPLIDAGTVSLADALMRGDREWSLEVLLRLCDEIRDIGWTLEMQR